jgi:integrase
LNSVGRRPKVTEAFEQAECPERCPVRIFSRYNELCPEDRPNDAFYLRPLKNYTQKSWYSKLPLGHNSLSTIVSKMCAEAGFGGYFANHSLRATAATRLFDANVDEQLIMQKTGHASNAVRRLVISFLFKFFSSVEFSVFHYNFYW